MLVCVAASLALAGCIELPEERSDAATNDGEERFTRADVSAPTCRPLDYSGGFGGGQGPGSQSGVSNTPGAFSYGGQVLARTTTETYAWMNPSPGVAVSWGGQSLTGWLTLRVYDACDELVVEETVQMLSQQGGFSMPADGTAGEWRIELAFQVYSGQMGLSITSA